VSVAKGQFGKGNTLGKGGKRPGSGRKPAAVKVAASEFYAGHLDMAEKVIEAALKEGDTEVARWVIEGHYGKHTQRMEVSSTGASMQDPLDRENARIMAALGKEA